jgi:hypothetical protein
MVYEYDGIPVKTFGYPFEQYLAQEILRRKHHDDQSWVCNNQQESRPGCQMRCCKRLAMRHSMTVG